MKKLLLFVSVIILASCATQHVFNAGKANTYLIAHKDRPAPIQEALSVGKLARGMNEEEVKICWGKPERIETRSMPNREIKFWRYFEDRAAGYSYRRQIKRKMLAKEVQFIDGVVFTWREIDSSS